MGLARMAAAVVAVAAIAACSGSATAGGGGSRAPASYYLALGDSLAQGVQPNAAGASVETGQGYADQLYAALRRDHPALRLVKLGCPGETTTTMMHGGICGYQGGSQLAAAVAFLRAHRGHVFLVTIDIGANDTEDCGSGQNLGQIASCFRTDIPGALRNLTTIMARITAAAGPGVRIAGMNYYLPALAEWRNGLVGRAVAWLIERLAVGYNDLLDHVYVSYGAQVANVFGAFDTSNFGDPVRTAGGGTLPRNVAMVCRLTWECTSPPRGPNQHANQAGYAVIAHAFLQATGLG
jgi:lysophospholipase L1-like esterase